MSVELLEIKEVAHMAVPIPEIIRPTTIIAKAVAPACSATPMRRMKVPKANA
jgi:hypothetical protein